MYKGPELVLNTTAVVTNVIVKRKGKWFVESEEGKNLGGPYTSEAAAEKRLAEVEAFKHMRANEFQSLQFNLKATAKPRHDEMEGRKYLVVPAVMMTVGVHAGSGGALYYPAEELGKTPVVWNHKPVVVYHPQVNGKPVSACDPLILSKQKVGVLMNTKFEDNKQKTEVWLDEERTKQVDNRILEAIDKGTVMEVSAGLFTDNEAAPGEWNGEKYDAIARNHRPDHLAILPDQVGACSVADGAGLLRLNQRPAEDSPEALLVCHYETVVNELSHSTIWGKLNELVRKGTNSVDVWVDEVFDAFFIFHKGDQLYLQGYITKEEEVELSGTSTKVERVVRYRTMDGVFIGNLDKESNMTKEELVAKIIANGVAATEKDNLMKLSEETLQKMISVEKPVTNKTEEIKPEVKPEVKAPEVLAPVVHKEDEPVTVEAYIAAAPEGIRDMLTAGLQVHQSEKVKMVAKVTANKRNRFTAEQLNAKGLGELQALADLATDPTAPKAPNFIGQGDPVVTDNKEEPLQAPSMDFGKK